LPDRLAGCAAEGNPGKGPEAIHSTASVVKPLYNTAKMSNTFPDAQFVSVNSFCYPFTAATPEDGIASCETVGGRPA
jgi:hypothetical protein